MSKYIKEITISVVWRDGEICAYDKKGNKHNCPYLECINERVPEFVPCKKCWADFMKDGKDE